MSMRLFDLVATITAILLFSITSVSYAGGSGGKIQLGDFDYHDESSFIDKKGIIYHKSHHRYERGKPKFKKKLDLATQRELNSHKRYQRDRDASQDVRIEEVNDASIRRDTHLSSGLDTLRADLQSTNDYLDAFSQDIREGVFRAGASAAAIGLLNDPGEFNTFSVSAAHARYGSQGAVAVGVAGRHHMFKGKFGASWDGNDALYGCSIGVDW